MSVPPEWGCGRAFRTAGSRCCGENAPAHGLRGGWEGPSAANESGLTDCPAGSYLACRDEWDPLSAALAGRERPPRKRPSRAQAGLSERSLRGSLLAGRRGIVGTAGPPQNHPTAVGMTDLMKSAQIVRRVGLDDPVSGRSSSEELMPSGSRTCGLALDVTARTDSPEVRRDSKLATAEKKYVEDTCEAV